MLRVWPLLSNRKLNGQSSACAPGALEIWWLRGISLDGCHPVTVFEENLSTVQRVTPLG